VKRGDLHSALYSEHACIEAKAIALNDCFYLCRASLQAATLFRHKEDEYSSTDIQCYCFVLLIKMSKLFVRREWDSVVQKLVK